jgi:hypothetical protein
MRQPPRRASVSARSPETPAWDDELRLSAPARHSRLLSAEIRASPSSTDQTPAIEGSGLARTPDDAHQTAAHGAACLALRLPCRADPIGAGDASCFGRNPSYDVPNNRAWRSRRRPHSRTWRSVRCYCSSVECESEPRAQKDSRASSRASAATAQDARSLLRQWRRRLPDAHRRRDVGTRRRPSPARTRRTGRARRSFSLTARNTSRESAPTRRSAKLDARAG